jgi:hypothetical protein
MLRSQFRVGRARGVAICAVARCADLSRNLLSLGWVDLGRCGLSQHGLHGQSSQYRAQRHGCKGCPKGKATHKAGGMVSPDCKAAHAACSPSGHPFGRRDHLKHLKKSGNRENR